MNNPYLKNTKNTVLIVDDDEDIQHLLTTILEKDYNIIVAGSGKEGLELIKRHHINVVLLDIILPDLHGISMLKTIKENYIDIEVIVITGLNNIETAIEAMKQGAFDFVVKIFDIDDLRLKVEKVFESLKQKKENIFLKNEFHEHLDMGFIAGECETMQKIMRLVKKVSCIPTTVLIQGESGTGKELLARIIWKESGLPNAPFVAVNMASIPPTLIESQLFGHEKGAFTDAVKQHLGKFEFANNGFLFLDEIGELQFDLQAKLLRVLQESEIERVGSNKVIPISVRLIAATNVNLLERVKKGLFREDLYYRLNVVPINLPPLRERREDIPVLANFFLEKYKRRFGRIFPKEITNAALELLARHIWPGNIRELENFIERLVAIQDCEVVCESDIPVEFQFSDFLKKGKHNNSNGEKSLFERAVITFEKNFILKALEQNAFSRIKTAEALEIPLSTLKYKLKQYGIYEILDEKNV